MSCALLPGTETMMRFEPCCCTFAPVKPWPLTRLFRIAMDCAMALELGVALPWPCLVRGTALIVIVVPLDRSRPRPTLNWLCQSPGCAAAVPMIVPSMTMSSAARTARYRQGLEITPGCRCEPPPGRDAVLGRDGDVPEPPAGVRGPDELLLGGATYACPSCERPAGRKDAAILQLPVVGRGGSSWWESASSSAAVAASGAGSSASPDGMSSWAGIGSSVTSPMSAARITVA